MELNTVEGKFLVASKDTGLYVRLFNFYGLSGIVPHPTLPIGDIFSGGDTAHRHQTGVEYQCQHQQPGASR